MILAARAKFREFSEKETEYRNKLSDLLKDPRVSANSEEVQKLKESVESNARQAEQMTVLCHEFNRQPDEKYLLTAGDVVYFNLAK